MFFVFVYIEIKDSAFRSFQKFKTDSESAFGLRRNRDKQMSGQQNVWRL